MVDTSSLTHEELVARLTAAENELDAMRQQVKLTSLLHSSTTGDGSVERNGTDSELFPTAKMGSHGRTSAILAQHHQQHLLANNERAHKDDPPIQVSFGVLVIEKGKSFNVPLTTVINKSYLRPDEREADTPVVHRDGSSYYENSRAFSADMVARIGGSAEGNFSIGGEHSPNATFSSSNYNPNASSADRRQDSISAELLVSGPDGNSPMFSGQRQLMEQQQGGAAKGLFIRPHALDPNRLSRLHSVGPDALLTNGTLNAFKRTFGGNTDAMTPVASSALAVYNYMNTFAENGFEHEDGAAEPFGRMMQQLCGEVERTLKGEPRHAAIVSPAFVFGDIHGNFRDLHYFMKSLIPFGDLRYTPHRFMFLGDYVDRGEFSVEVIAFLFAMKAIAPDKIMLLRGNHEDTLVSGDLGNYGSTSFRAQCRNIFGPILGEDVWNKASNAFASLPLTGSIDHKIFCTHGGLPRYLGGPDKRLAELSREDFPRFLSFFQVPEDETPEQQRLRQMGTDTCWADPADDERMLDQFGFGANPRGQGVILFGSEAVDHFLDTYGYEMIFRAHQEKADGLKLSKNARVFTIFSTSAYVGHSNGAGVVMVADGKVRLIIKTADNDDE